MWSNPLKLFSNIGTQGMQELFFVNTKALEAVNIACMSMVLPVQSFKSDWSCQFSLRVVL